MAPWTKHLSCMWGPMFWCPGYTHSQENTVAASWEAEPTHASENWLAQVEPVSSGSTMRPSIEKYSGEQ